MAEEQKRDELDLRLPSELKYDEFFSEGRKWSEDSGSLRAFGSEIPFMFASSIESPVASVTETETESEDEDYLAGLTQRMAQSFLHDDDENHEASRLPAKATMTVSPQSTLCSFLTATENSFPAVKENTEVQKHITDQETKNPMPEVLVPRAAANNQVQDEQKPQPPSAWTAQNKPRIGAGNYRALGVPSSAWPALQKNQQQPQSQPPPPQQPVLSPGMRPVFLSSPGMKKESTGTGVFLPRFTGTNFEPPRRKPACSMVLVPARVAQALNLNLEEFGAQPRFTAGGGYAGYVLDQEALLSRSNNIASSYHKRNGHLRPQHAVVDSPDINLLPQEWTY